MSWPHFASPQPSGRRLLSYVALALSYVIAGRLGLFLAVPPGYATAIFPPAGIAVAAVFIGGRNTLPWTFLGSLALNLWVGYDVHQQVTGLGIAVAVAIAVASMAQAAVGGWGLRRVIGYPNALDNGSDLLRFFASAPVICLASGSLSLSAMAALGAIAGAQFVMSWVTWWIGDTLGVLLFLPLVMVVAGAPSALWRGRALSVALADAAVLRAVRRHFRPRQRLGSTINRCSSSACSRSRSCRPVQAQLRAQEAFLDAASRVVQRARTNLSRAISPTWHKCRCGVSQSSRPSNGRRVSMHAQRDAFEAAQRRERGRVRNPRARCGRPIASRRRSARVSIP